MDGSGGLAEHVDLDLHGLVGVRLVDPRSCDVLTVVRQLGLTPTRLSREPDLVLRFVDALPTDGTLRPLGAGAYAHDDSAFYAVVRGGQGSRRVRFGFGSLGRAGHELVCEHGVAGVPLLMDVLNLSALANGLLPLHASAFTREGTGVLVTGWAKGGKTETLLGFMAQGATHVGDEWVYLPGDGRMLGIPEPMRVWQWHLDDLPSLRSRLTGRDRARLGTVQVAETALRRAGGGSGLVGRVADAVGRQRFVHVRPQVFFDGASTLTGRLGQVFLTVTHDDPTVAVLPVSATEVARRMTASLQLERSRLWEAYAHALFAFPDDRSPALEGAGAREAELLTRALAGVPAHEVRHPYPVDIPAVVRAMTPFLLASS